MHQQYYFITIEYYETPPSLVISGVQAKPVMVRTNAIINIHPAIYAINKQHEIPTLVVTFAMVIPHDIYEMIQQGVKVVKSNGQGVIESEREV